MSTTNTATPPATEAKGKTSQTKGEQDKAKAQALYQSVCAQILAMQDALSKEQVGPLALKEAAEAFGRQVTEEGRPQFSEWIALAVFAASVPSNLRLRIEMGDLARKHAKEKLRLQPKYAADDKALGRALDKCVSFRGQRSGHDLGATVAVKFGIPGKVAAVFE